MMPASAWLSQIQSPEEPLVVQYPQDSRFDPESHLTAPHAQISALPALPEVYRLAPLIFRIKLHIGLLYLASKEELVWVQTR